MSDRQFSGDPNYKIPDGVAPNHRRWNGPKKTESDTELPLPEANSAPAESSADSVWRMDIQYNDGAIDTLRFDSTGELTKPHKSERLTLIDLLGFKLQRFSPSIDIGLGAALADTGLALGLNPVFDTYDGPTTVLGQIIAFEQES